MSFNTTIKKKKKIKSGFTLIEIILALVVILLISSLLVPNLSGSQKNFKLLTSARNIEKICKFARGMSVLREKKLIVTIDLDKNNICVGELKNFTETNPVVESDENQLNIDNEIIKNISKGVIISEFLNENSKYDVYENYCYITFFPNGHCDKFSVNLNFKDLVLNISSDPISGKVISKYMQ